VSERPSLREAARDVLEADDALSKLLKGRPISEAEFFASQEREERMEALRAALSAPSPEPGERGDLEELERLEKAATPAPWMLWDSCSWRRIGRTDQTTSVLTPTRHPWDGHSDLDCREADMDLLIAARNALPALLAELRAHRAFAEACEPVIARLGTMDVLEQLSPGPELEHRRSWLVDGLISMAQARAILVAWDALRAHRAREEGR